MDDPTDHDFVRDEIDLIATMTAKLERMARDGVKMRQVGAFALGADEERMRRAVVAAFVDLLTALRESLEEHG
jgi:hypothetical protein